MGHFVFVGTRQPGRVALNAMNLFQTAATELGARGFVVRTGGEVGSDRMAADAALAAGGRVELYLPYAGFADEWVGYQTARYEGRCVTLTFDPELHGEWAKCVRSIHPNGKFLSRASTANLARSCGMVLGATAVIALPYVRRKDRGVSGIVLDLARSLHVPAYDLSYGDDCQSLRAMLDANVPCAAKA